MVFIKLNELTESLITISVIGLVAGFIFSMPVTGPISILVITNALKGRISYCNLLAAGSAIADFLYIILGVYGITQLFTEYSFLIPYILGSGALFIMYVGIRIIRTKFDTEHADEETILSEKHIKKHRGAFYTGFMINFLNPTIFFGWMASSFIALSFASSLGFDTGGLNASMDSNIEQIEKIDKDFAQKPQLPSYLQIDTLSILKKENQSRAGASGAPAHFHLIVTLLYSFFLSLGSVLWFILFASLLARFRKMININVLNWLIRGMGIALCLFAVYFCYTAVKMLA